MKVYFAGAIRAGRDLQPTYAVIVDHLKNIGHTILSHHVAAKNVLSEETKLSTQGIYMRDVKWLEETDVVVADVTIPSLGVGYEIAYALLHKVPVLCICEEGVNLSAMISGNTDENISVEYYSSVEHVIEVIDAWINTKSKTK